MKIFKIIYYIFLAFIVVIAVLLIFSVFPITGNYKIMVVQSGSMEPAVKLGSVVLVKPAQDYKIGNIITFLNRETPQKPITHRIVEIKIQNDQTFYTTKGDANNASDNWKISKEKILGKVLISLPYLGYVVATAKKPLGFVLIIIIPATIIIFDEMKKIYEEIKKKKTSEK